MASLANGVPKRLHAGDLFRRVQAHSRRRKDQRASCQQDRGDHRVNRWRPGRPGQLQALYSLSPPCLNGAYMNRTAWQSVSETDGFVGWWIPPETWPRTTCSGEIVCHRKSLCKNCVTLPTSTTV